MTSYQVSAEAYAGTEVSGHVLDQKNIRGHASAVVDGVLGSIHRNTVIRHVWWVRAGSNSMTT